MAGPDDRTPRRSADHLLTLLRLFTVDRPAWTAEAAAAALGLSRSTLYRHLRSLTAAGLIDPSGPGGAYVLGPAVIEFDRTIRLTDPILTAARPTLSWLAARMAANGALLLCRLYQDRVMCIHQEIPEGATPRVNHERGRPLPLFRGAASKAILAHLDGRALRGFHRRHEGAIGQDFEAFAAPLRVIRRQGFCLSRGEIDPEMTGLGVPLFSARRQVLGSLCIAVRGPIEAPAIARLSTLIVAAGREIDAAVAAGTRNHAEAAE